MFYFILGLHEALQLYYFTGNFGMYDRFLRGEALGILIASFVLYIYCEAKFFYLAYLVDEALEHTKKKDCQRSEAILKKALIIYPYYSTALNNLGNVYFRMKEYTKAKECYDLVIDFDPGYKKAQLNLELARKRVGRKMEQ